MQDKWTIDRVTLSMGVRYDWFNSENPEYHLGPSILTPNRNYDVPAFDTTRYKDFTPKVAMAWDVFGDGKTAIKANYGKYVLGQALVVGGLASQPGYNVQLTSSRRGSTTTATSFLTAIYPQHTTRVRRRSVSIDRWTRATPPQQQTPTSTATH